MGPCAIGMTSSIGCRIPGGLMRRMPPVGPMKPALLLVAAWLASAGARAGEFRFFEPLQPPRRVQVMAHRGAREVAPENTTVAIARSIADTVEWVEVDVRLTRDGHHVLIHDADLDRTTDGAGRVDG